MSAANDPIIAHAIFADDLNRELEVEKQKFIEAKRAGEAATSKLASMQPKFDQEHARGTTAGGLR